MFPTLLLVNMDRTDGKQINDISMQYQKHQVEGTVTFRINRHDLGRFESHCVITESRELSILS